MDDASEDNTVSMLTSMLAEDPLIPIRLISLDSNRGPSHARNVAWNVATGSHVAFLDSDDEWLPDKLLLQATALKATDAILLGQTYPFLNRFSLPLFRVQRSNILIRNCYWTSTAVVKRSVPERFHESLRRCEDHLLFCMLTIAHDRSYYLSAPLVRQHKLPVGQSGLSKSLLQMQLGNWQLYSILMNEHYIGVADFALLELLATLKFLARPFRVALWRAKGIV